MDEELIEVTNFLITHNKNIISGHSKLCLAVPLLHKINLALQVPQCTESVRRACQSSLNHNEIETLKNIISKVPKLCITQAIKTTKWRVDISRFEKLQYIEIRNIPIKYVEGIKSLRHQLRVLICDNVSNSFNDIIGYSDLWEELHTAKLCCNGFEILTQFYNTPWLQYLDLSYNKLSGKLLFQSMKNLKFLNLSFNYLNILPVLSEETYQSLKVMLLKNNLFENLSMIRMFSGLEEIDISYNLLADHSALSSVPYLSNLRCLNLSNNPISYHLYHRLNTCRSLNKYAIFNDFWLDERQLNPIEKYEIFQYQLIKNHTFVLDHRPNTSFGIFSKSDALTIPKKKILFKTGSRNVEQNNLLISPESVKIMLYTKNGVQKLVKRADRWLQGNCESSLQCTTEFNRPTDHTVTTYASHNLHSFSPNLTEMNYFNYQTLILHSYSENVTPHSAMSIGNNYLYDYDGVIFLCFDNCDKLKKDLLAVGINSDYLNSKVEITSSSNNEGETELKQFAMDSDRENKIAGADDDDGSSSENSVDELLAAEKKLVDGSLFSVLVALGEFHIKEISIVNGHTLFSWSLRSIRSCEKLTCNPPIIRIVFNRAHKEFRERIYLMETLYADKLQNKIQSFLEGRPLCSMNQHFCRCLICDSTFSQELQQYILSSITVPCETGTSKHESTIKCFKCGSSLVIINEGNSCSSNETENNLMDSEFSSFSSYEAKRQMSFEFFKQKAAVFTETGVLKRDLIIKDLPVLSSGTEYGSDIEVISNPSQSSIDVAEMQAEVYI